MGHGCGLGRWALGGAPETQEVQDRSTGAVSEGWEAGTGNGGEVQGGARGTGVVAGCSMLGCGTGVRIVGVG